MFSNLRWKQEHTNTTVPSSTGDQIIYTIYANPIYLISTDTIASNSFSILENEPEDYYSDPYSKQAFHIDPARLEKSCFRDKARSLFSMPFLIENCAAKREKRLQSYRKQVAPLNVKNITRYKHPQPAHV